MRSSTAACCDFFIRRLVSTRAVSGLAASLRACACAMPLASVGGTHAIDQAHFQRGFGHEGLAQQQRLGRAVVAEHLRHQQARCGLRAQAEVDEGHREGRVVAGIDQVAMEQHRRADAHCRAAHGRHDRLREGGDAAQEAEHRRFLRRGRLLRKSPMSLPALKIVASPWISTARTAPSCVGLAPAHRPVRRTSRSVIEFFLSRRLKVMVITPASVWTRMSLMVSPC